MRFLNGIKAFLCSLGARVLSLFTPARKTKGKRKSKATKKAR